MLGSVEVRRVILCQVPAPPLAGPPLRGNTPYAAACLALHARAAGLAEAFDIRVLPAREVNHAGDRALLDRILDEAPLLVGFTAYLWNVDRVLWLAARLKAARPDVLVAVGGPEVTPDVPRVREHPAVDFAVFGEGEGTFAALLAALAAGDPAAARALPGLGANPPRPTLPDLDAVASPYVGGILAADADDPYLVETARGCVYKCRYCYYPQAYDGVIRVSSGRLAANLRHARSAGARDVFFLDPTLNQRPDFTEFLRLVVRENPAPRLALHAEARAESITPEQAALLGEAGFAELEIGLQSVDPGAQRLMGRRTPLDLFARGVRAVRAAGVRAKVDLIVGLPGDTPATIRAGYRFLREEGLFDEIQVFPLSVLPGTPFRRDAAALGLVHDPRPPYFVRRTPALSEDDITGLLDEAEDCFERTFDPLPPPDPASAWPGMPGAPAIHRLDLDREPVALPARTSAPFTLVLRAADAWRRRDGIAAAARALAAAEPFSPSVLVLDTDGEFPFDLFDAIEAASATPENLYLERVREYLPGRPPLMRRIAVVLPAAARPALDPEWVRDLGDFAEGFFRDGDRFLPFASLGTPSG